MGLRDCDLERLVRGYHDDFTKLLAQLEIEVRTAQRRCDEPRGEEVTQWEMEACEHALDGWLSEATSLVDFCIRELQRLG